MTAAVWDFAPEFRRVYGECSSLIPKNSNRVVTFYKFCIVFLLLDTRISKSGNKRTIITHPGRVALKTLNAQKYILLLSVVLANSANVKCRLGYILQGREACRPDSCALCIAAYIMNMNIEEVWERICRKPVVKWWCKIVTARRNKGLSSKIKYKMNI